MVNTIAKLKSSSADKGSAALVHNTPSSLISSVDMTLIPSPIQVFDKKQAKIFSALQHKQTQCIHYNLIEMQHT